MLSPHLFFLFRFQGFAAFDVSPVALGGRIEFLNTLSSF